MDSLIDQFELRIVIINEMILFEDIKGIPTVVNEFYSLIVKNFQFVIVKINSLPFRG